MGKRSSFARRPQDAYDTPREALGLLQSEFGGGTYWEPCAGAGAIMGALDGCIYATDCEPRADGIERRDALSVSVSDLLGIDLIITNPPWTRSILHPMIEHFRSMRPTWLLFDADWMHTRQAAPFLPYCHKIVSVGRVKWMPDSPHTGKDNAAWYLFDREPAETVFVGRQAIG